MLPENPQGKALQAKVVTVGSGSEGKGGGFPPVREKVGDRPPRIGRHQNSSRWPGSFLI